MAPSPLVISFLNRNRGVAELDGEKFLSRGLRHAAELRRVPVVDLALACGDGDAAARFRLVAAGYRVRVF